MLIDIIPCHESSNISIQLSEENISKDADLHGFYCPNTQGENSSLTQNVHVNYYIKLTKQ